LSLATFRVVGTDGESKPHKVESRDMLTPDESAVLSVARMCLGKGIGVEVICEALIVATLRPPTVPTKGGRR
jgi:hypothetical protein